VTFGAVLLGVALGFLPSKRSEVEVRPWCVTRVGALCLMRGSAGTKVLDGSLDLRIDFFG
jgi:hypothetical protein